MILSVDSFKNQYHSYLVAKGEAEKEQKNWRVYSAVKPTIVFPPQPLSVFCQGISGQMGHSVKIKLGEKPLLGEGTALIISITIQIPLNRLVID
jgi:hypothetical protein